MQSPSLTDISSNSSLALEWLGRQPVVSTLATLLPPNLHDVAHMSTDKIDEISSIFSLKLNELLKNSCSKLKIALANDSIRVANKKFGTYEGNFGTISNFHTLPYDEIGSPDPQWERGMKREHSSNDSLFTTTNYGLETCPRDEWRYTVDGVPPPAEAMGHGRVLKPIDQYMSMHVTLQAGLTRPEVISLVLYTGPMFVIWNTILRKYPMDRYETLKRRNSLFPTSIFVLMSAIQKVSRVMVLQPGQCLYRGIDGNMTLPRHFTEVDSRGCVGMMELGFMSTTADINVAISYSGVDKGKACPKVFEIRIGSVDRGADIHEFSQYPGEAEYLWAPHAFLEPIGANEVVVTEHGVVQLIKVRANSNLKVVTLEEYEVRKKEMHLNSFKTQLQDLHLTLDEIASRGATKSSKIFVGNIMSQCDEVFQRHVAKAAATFNDDSAYRSLVTEMLDTETHAMVKMDYLLSRILHNEADLAKPLRMAFRDRMGQRTMMLRANPAVDVALDLCKKFGLVVSAVTEVNELGETPLVTACAEGVTNDKLELLLLAGSDPNGKVSYSGVLRKGMTPALTAAVYGRTSMLQLLAEHGADVEAVSDQRGVSAMYFAAQDGHITTIKLLHSLGVSINRPNKDGGTPIYIAANNGHTAAVELLVSLGADINRAMVDGRTPLSAAANNGHNAVVSLLCQHGGDVNKPMPDGCTPLSAAAQEGHATTVELLHSLGANVNTQDVQGFSPVYTAAQEGHASTVEVLHALGADINLPCDAGITPLSMAAQEGHTACVVLLHSLGADVNRPRRNGMSPVYVAAQEGHAETVEALLRVGADAAVPWRGWTPLDRAAGRGHKDVVKVLKAAGLLSTRFPDA